MDRAFASGSSGTPPSAPGSPSIGYPTAGNPGGGTPATKPGPYWYHMITEELRAIISAAGLTPAQGTIDQVLQALPNALASRPEMAKSLAQNGYQKLPGGLIVQWGVTANCTTGTDMFQTLPLTFPNAGYAVIISEGYTFNSGSIGYFCGGFNSLSQIVWRGTGGGNSGFFVAFGK